MFVVSQFASGFGRPNRTSSPGLHFQSSSTRRKPTLARKGGDLRDSAYAYNVLSRIRPGPTDDVFREMKIDDLLNKTGEWLKGTGPSSGVVISSRV